MDVQDPRVGSGLTVDSARHLRVVEVGVHVSVRVEEPGINVLDDSLDVRVGAVKSPCEGVEKYGVGEAVKVTDVIDDTAVRIKLSVARIIVAFCPH